MSSILIFTTSYSFTSVVKSNVMLLFSSIEFFKVSTNFYKLRIENCEIIIIIPNSVLSFLSSSPRNRYVPFQDFIHTIFLNDKFLK